VIEAPDYAALASVLHLEQARALGVVVSLGLKPLLRGCDAPRRMSYGLTLDLPPVRNRLSGNTRCWPTLVDQGRRVVSIFGMA